MKALILLALILFTSSWTWAFVGVWESAPSRALVVVRRRSPRQKLHRPCLRPFPPPSRSSEHHDHHHRYDFPGGMSSSVLVLEMSSSDAFSKPENLDLEEQIRSLEEQVAELLEDKAQQETINKKLLEDNAQQNQTIAELLEGKAQQNQTIAEVKQEVAGIRGSMEPAVVWALMEYAVYEALDAEFVLPKKGLSKLKNISTSEMDKLKFTTAQAAGKLIQVMMDSPNNYQASGSPSIFTGNKAIKDDKTGAQPRSSTLLRDTMCFGVAVFVTSMKDRAEFEKWPADRNPLCHNGWLLKCLYQPSLDTPSFSKETVVSLQVDIKANLTKFRAGSESSGAKAILNAFSGSGITTSWSETDIEEALKPMLVVE